MRKITNLNENWYFIKNQPDNLAGKTSFEDTEKVHLPHTWNNLDGQDGGDDYARIECWYFKELTITEIRTTFVECMGASLVADVYMNGHHIINHKGGFSIFRGNVTPYLVKGKNILAIKVDNSKKEKVYPQRADFTFFGGLYRDVNLIEVDETYFELDHLGTKGIKVTPIVKGKKAEVTIEAQVHQPQKDQSIVFEIFSKEQETPMLMEQDISKCDATFTIEKPHLWHGIVDPFLYTARVSIKDQGVILDQLEVPFGIRSFKIDPEKGFFLNGKSYPLRGVCRHQDRFNMGWAITPKEHKEDIDLIKEVGANTIRLAHYQHDQYFYDLCDQYGMVVWAEIPFISKMYEEREAQENALSQMRELIVQNYNHPSIICWGIANEITLKGYAEGVLENLKELNTLTKSLDSTRYSTMAHMSYIEPDGPFNKITDIVSYNHYMGWYYSNVQENGPHLDADHAKNPTLCMGMSEYGAEGNIHYHTDDPKQSDYSEEYHTFYHEEMLKVITPRKYLWSTHVWNMFEFACDARDEGGVQGRNNKGLVTYDRKIKKDAFFIYKAYWSQTPFVHLCEKRFAKRCTENIKIKVFSNQKKITLFVNDKKIATKSGQYSFVFDDVLLNKGENKVVVTSGTLSDEATFILQDDFELSYINQDTRKKEDLVSKWHKD